MVQTSKVGNLPKRETDALLIARVPTHDNDNAHSWGLCSAALLGDQADGTMTQYHTRSHCPDTELTVLAIC